MTLDDLYNMINAPQDTSSVRPSDVLEAVWARLTDEDEARARQVQDELRGLEDLKRLNALYPTQKRTKAIEELERRYRKAGILQ
jgi:hypothetical protein